MLKEKSLKCTNCDKPIQANELFSVELRMPSSFKMPYGALDAALYKQAEKVLCSVCKN